MEMPLFVGREKSIQALEAAMESDKKLLLVTQKEAAHDDPTLNELYDVGTIANILQMLKLPDGTVKVLIEGQSRAVITALEEKDCTQATCHELVDQMSNENELKALVSALQNSLSNSRSSARRCRMKSWHP
jgi:ATP-dependent Lon protease